MFNLFRGAANRKVIDRIHSEIVAAARNPILFTDYGVEDTLDGRFELVVLHAALVVHRLQALPQPGPDVAQDLANALFRHFDVALREMGVGDTTVPKKMKTMAEAFLGRAMAYFDAIEKDRPVLAAALSRNIYAGKNDGVKLARYVQELNERLATIPLDELLNGPIAFPKPEDIG
jgi:cytochrome b pre-mRNA-processing protein 3